MVISRQAVIGVLTVLYAEQGRAFTQEQVDLMERFAALASLAIDNARLYEQAQKEIHERILIEVELRASEERFRKIFQASPVAIIISSLEDGRIIEANHAYWKLTGFDPEKSVGRTALELGIWANEDERKDFVTQTNQSQLSNRLTSETQSKEVLQSDEPMRKKSIGILVCEIP